MKERERNLELSKRISRERTGLEHMSGGNFLSRTIPKGSNATVHASHAAYYAVTSIEQT